MSRYNEFDEKDYERPGRRYADDYEARHPEERAPIPPSRPSGSNYGAQPDVNTSQPDRATLAPSSYGARDDRSQYGVPSRASLTHFHDAPPHQDRSFQPQMSGPLSIARGSERRAPSIAASSSRAGITEISESLEKLPLTSYYVRPGYGEAGKPLTVQSNFFQVRSTENRRAKIIYHYDVDIEPVKQRGENSKKPKGLLRAVWEQLCLEHQGIFAEGLSISAYDGRRNAFTPNRLPIPEGEYSENVALAPDGIVHRPGRGSSSDEENRQWTLVLKLVAVIDLEIVMEFCRTEKKAPANEERCLTGIMATNVLMRDFPSKTYAQVGATGNKFFSMAGAIAIPQGAIVCKGFMQSVRYTSSGLPLLNLYIGFSAFLSDGPALEVIAKILTQSGARGGRGRDGYQGTSSQNRDLSQMSDIEISLVKRTIRGTKFKVTHRKSDRLHTVLSLTLQPAEAITFDIQGRDGGENRKISIIEYYRLYHHVQVTKPRLPCIQYGKKAFIPLEFVHFAQWNSLPPTKLNAEQTAEMIKVSAIKPQERAKLVTDWRAELAHEKQAKIAAWGLQVNKKMIQLQARILPPPRVSYADGTGIVPRDGTWNLRGKRFFKNGKKPLIAWSVVSFEKYTEQDEMHRYIHYLVNVLQAHGVQVITKQPDCIGPIDPRGPRAIPNALQQAARAAYMVGKCAPQLICCILPGRDAWLYELIKKSSFTDLKGPVPTQCMQAAKIRNPRGIDAYTGNLVMKIQNKLGGVPHQVSVSEMPGMVRGKTMLLGGDLGLPPIKAGNESSPTVACTIATYNADCDSYSAQIRLQEGRAEIISELSSMIEEHLKIFHKHNGQYPERILIFRDGISEGQYAAVLSYEHVAILKACKRLQTDYRPLLLMCICAKRHTTRFFGKDADVDRSGNLPSGLVVDQSVTHPYAFDFFLQAHAGRVGTARPTHYICLLDELAMTPDQLQQLVHALCHSFTRCTTSVSLVPVCYIADLVCQKARIIVHDPEASEAPSVSSAGRSDTTRSRKTGFNIDVMQVQRLLQRNDELAEVAWWM
uniref:Argonaute n=1 Tax=Kwoniella dejecticola CBS 10117 TaxID=1296121 RepID=A0A1A6AHD1_9TREE|nr:uncharacterized protein I303_01293 [Kwoniella dejecticola CBS 10117]OBR89466.1 hypothetical protein I303_01293 [Kwoniella dejecticola CBS 10117]